MPVLKLSSIVGSDIQRKKTTTQSYWLTDIQEAIISQNEVLVTQQSCWKSETSWSETWIEPHLWDHTSSLRLLGLCLPWGNFFYRLSIPSHKNFTHLWLINHLLQTETNLVVGWGELCNLGPLPRLVLSFCCFFFFLFAWGITCVQKERVSENRIYIHRKRLIKVK